MASNARPLSPDHIDYGVATPAPYGRTGPAVQMTSEPRASVRSIPSVDSLLRSVPGRKAAMKFGRPVVKRALQQTLEQIRRDVIGDSAIPDNADILARAIGAAARTYYGISEVINATGVLLHTGLGRAPLPDRAADAAAQAARGYADLEIDRESGARGRRTSRAEGLVEALTGAEASAIVNNNAGALLLALAALATRKDVLVSRGELIEIGGEFRLPEIMQVSGARLVEVGTTNRSRGKDYEQAISSKTGLILKVHPSNYRVVGFSRTVELPELAEIGRRRRVPVMYDVGSGLLERFPEVPEEEPSVTEALARGADLVSFSGDKLLGGPQAGVLVGRRDLIERIRSHPMARALRIDKMTVAAMEAVLRLYATGRRDEIPLWRLLSMRLSKIDDRARAVASCFRGATTRKGQSVVGGGSLPGYAIPSAHVVIPVPSASRVAARLRLGRPPVFCRIEDDGLLFDLRTVPPEEDDRLIRAVRYALEQD